MQQSGPDAAALRELRRQSWRAVVPAAVVVALASAWSMTAPLSGAVIAPAQLKVELNRKTVQHQEGGIVRQVLVRDGQKVRAGEPLIVVGDVRSDSTLKLLQDQLAAEKIPAKRAAAEAALAPHFSAPADSREHALFVTRRRILDEQIASLQTQIREAEAQASATGADRGDRDLGAALGRGARDERPARAPGLREPHAPARAAAHGGRLPRARGRVPQRARRRAPAHRRHARARRRATSIRARPPTSCATRPPRCATWKSACARRKTRSSARSCARRSTAK